MHVLCDADDMSVLKLHNVRREERSNRSLSCSLHIEEMDVVSAARLAPISSMPVVSRHRAKACLFSVSRRRLQAVGNLEPLKTKSLRADLL